MMMMKKRMRRSSSRTRRKSRTRSRRRKNRRRGRRKEKKKKMKEDQKIENEEHSLKKKGKKRQALYGHGKLLLHQQAWASGHVRDLRHDIMPCSQCSARASLNEVTPRSCGIANSKLCTRAALLESEQSCIY